MTTRSISASPRFLARMTGVFFLLTILAGIFAQGFVSERLIDFRSAASTAANILAHKGLFQLGFTVYLIEMTCQITTAVLFYQLMSPVNRTVALLYLVLELTGCIVKICARVFFITPLFVLERPAAFEALGAEQMQSAVLMLLKVNDVGAGVALALFGFSTLLGGYLVFRSTFLPRWLGMLSLVAGLGWLTFLYPSFGYQAFPVAALCGLLGAAATIFWLLVFGVNEARWFKQAAA